MTTVNRYVVLKPGLKHNGVDYPVGMPLALSIKYAQPLIDIGMIQEQAGALPTMPSVPKLTPTTLGAVDSGSGDDSLVPLMARTNGVTRRNEISGFNRIPVGNVQRIRRVTDFFDGIDPTSVTFAVGANGEAAAFNTVIGNVGKTPYGQRSVRLTTAAVNGSFAEFTVKQNNTNYLQNVAVLDFSMPITIIIAPHQTNGGSHLKLTLASSNATDAGAVRVSGDMYISGLAISTEPQQAVVALQYNLRSLVPSGNLVDVIPYLNKLRIQAYQEGAGGVTDITILGVYQATERPMLHIGFDDGLKSVYDYAFPIMRDRGLVASVAVMGANVGMTPSTRQLYSNMPLMSKTELDELVAAGWEMTVHGVVGPTGLTYDQAYALLLGQKQAVEALGAEYKKSSDFYVYPGGSGNWTADADGQPIGPKALKAAGYRHGRLLYGGGCYFSHAFCGLGQAPLMQNSLTHNMYRSASITAYETADYVTRIKDFAITLEKISQGQGFCEILTHNVVPRSFFPSGTPYVSENAVWTGTVAISNDVSVETFTAMMDLVAHYRDIGLIDVVLKRDWLDGVPNSLEDRKALAACWTR
jgi:peptidoglycan/xylan/chitin deacetylase (PgdA/CDA1 family)